MRRVPVSTGLFWSQVFDEKPPRSLWQSFRHLTSWLAQMLILLTLVLAAADPLLKSSLREAERLVIVIDNSASMAVMAGSTTRLELGRTAAKTLVHGLRHQDEAAVIVANTGTRIVTGMTDHAASLLRAIDSVTIADTGTSLQAAIELGQRLIGDNRRGRIVVVTDGCVCASSTANAAAADSPATPVAEPIPENSEVSAMEKSEQPAAAGGSTNQSLVQVEFLRVGEATGNVGITAFQVRRSLVDPVGYEILASVRNASSVGVSCQMELSLNGLPIDVIPMTLKADEQWTRSLPKLSAEGGQLRADLIEIRRDGPEGVAGLEQSGSVDGLLTDNSGWAILSPATKQKVFLVTPGNLFVQKVFEANPLVELTVVNALPAAAEWPAGSVIVLHELVPERLPAGNLVVLDPATGCDAWTIGATIENPVIAVQTETSPLMKNIQLDNVLIPEARQLTFREQTESLVETVDGESLCSLWKRKNGDCVVVPVAFQRSDLAFRTVFPILMSNILNWYAGESSERRLTLAAGANATVSLRLPMVDRGAGDTAAAESRFFLTAPNGERARISATSKPAAADDSASDTVTLLTGPLQQVGIWSVSGGDVQGSRPLTPAVNELEEFAVNLANDCETNLRPATEFDLPDKSPGGIAGLVSRPIWFYLVLTACAFLAAEWALYHRRWIS